MSRHDPASDDFSFLPTVDDTEAVSAEELWARARSHIAQPEVEAEYEPEYEPETVEAVEAVEAEVTEEFYAEDESYISDDTPPNELTAEAESFENEWEEVAAEPALEEQQEEIWDDAEPLAVEAEHPDQPWTDEEEAYPSQEPAVEEVTALPHEEFVAEWDSLDEEEELAITQVKSTQAPAIQRVGPPALPAAKAVREEAPAYQKQAEPTSEKKSRRAEAAESIEIAEPELEHSPHIVISDEIEPKVVVGEQNAILEPEAPADIEAELAKAKRSAIMFSIVSVVGLMVLLALIRIVVPEGPAVEITAYSAADALTESESLKKVASAAPQTTPMAASIMPIAAAGVSDFAIPQVEISTSSADLNIGSSMGSFTGGISSGTAGGTISFMGNRGTGKRIVFVVDVSSSMSARGSGEGAGLTRFELLKRELSRSLSGMPTGAQYQVIFFSDFGWAHDEVDSTKPDQLQKAFWEISSETVASAKIPHARYVTASLNTLRRSKDIVNAADNPGGTNWGSGLIMALSMRPAPDVIFFMTDGNRNDESGWIDAVSSFNAKQGSRTIIHTTAMMEPDAATELNEMANKNRGKFTVVLSNGKIVKGEDWFKGVRQ